MTIKKYIESLPKSTIGQMLTGILLYLYMFGHITDAQACMAWFVLQTLGFAVNVDKIKSALSKFPFLKK